MACGRAVPRPKIRSPLVQGPAREWFVNRAETTLKELVASMQGLGAWTGWTGFVEQPRGVARRHRHKLE